MAHAELGLTCFIEKLSQIVRSVDEAKQREYRSTQNTPTQWDSQTVRDRPRSRDSSSRMPQRDSRESQSQRDSKESQRERIERYGSQSSSRRGDHARNGSSGTGIASSDGYRDEVNGGRRHDYDVQSMETDLSSPRVSMARNPIPPPAVTVRSEYPTLNRSRQPQPLTCLITIEVPEGKWSPDPEDLRSAPPQLQAMHQEKEVVSQQSAEVVRPHEWQSETPEELEEITEDLRIRVDNWHGLDFKRHDLATMRVASQSNRLSRFGKLRLHCTIRVGRDRRSWQELECFLFAEMLICIKEKRGAVPSYAEGNAKRKLTKCTLKGSILIKKHLRHVQAVPGMSPDELI